MIGMMMRMKYRICHLYLCVVRVHEYLLYRHPLLLRVHDRVNMPRNVLVWRVNSRLSEGVYGRGCSWVVPEGSCCWFWRQRQLSFLPCVAQQELAVLTICLCLA